MSCILRITSPHVQATLGQCSSKPLQPYRIDNETAHFHVSHSDFDQLADQVQEAIVFLDDNQDDLMALLATPSSSGILDFAIEVDSCGFQWAKLPAELVRKAGLLGLGLELSLYPCAPESENPPSTHAASPTAPRFAPSPDSGEGPDRTGT